MTVADTFTTPASLPKRALPEVGVPGTKHWGGYILLEELVPELSWPRDLDTYDRMRRTDGTIQALLRALKLPLRSATWEIDPASADAADAMVADFVRWNLFEGLSHSFKRHIREALTCLDFGFSVFELVWGEKIEIDGQFRLPLRKIAARLQRTITKWYTARDGGLTGMPGGPSGIQQSLYGSGIQGGYVDIDIERLAIYVHEQEGANWRGVSVLRPAYKHWWMKDNFYKFQAIGAERFSVGIPVVKIGEDDSGDQVALDRAEAIGENIRANEKGSVALPNDWEFTIAGVDGRPYDLLKPIEHHDLAILRSIHAHFLTLGAQGSNALSTDQSSFFLMHERAIGDEIADVVNRFIIPKLVDANWSGVRRYPKLAVRKIETRELEKYFNALAVLAGQGLITADDPTEDELRALAGLRSHDKTTARKRAAAPAPQPQPAGQRPGTEPPPPAEGGTTA